MLQLNKPKIAMPNMEMNDVQVTEFSGLHWILSKATRILLKGHFYILLNTSITSFVTQS